MMALIGDRFTPPRLKRSAVRGYLLPFARFRLVSHSCLSAAATDAARGCPDIGGGRGRRVGGGVYAARAEGRAAAEAGRTHVPSCFLPSLFASP